MGLYLWVDLDHFSSQGRYAIEQGFERYKVYMEGYWCEMGRGHQSGATLVEFSIIISIILLSTLPFMGDFSSKIASSYGDATLQLSKTYTASPGRAGGTEGSEDLEPGSPLIEVSGLEVL